MPIPLYGFMEGDTIGLLILADEDETIHTLAEKLQEAASIRVAPGGKLQVVFQNSILEPKATVAETGLAPLDRFDVVHI